MEKINYSVARVVTYTKQSIGKAERHNERKNKVYSNMNVDLEQTKNNVYYKTCDKTYNERLKEIDNLIQHIYEDNVSGKISDEMFSNFSTKYIKK